MRLPSRRGRRSYKMWEPHPRRWVVVCEAFIATRASLLQNTVHTNDIGSDSSIRDESFELDRPPHIGLKMCKRQSNADLFHVKQQKTSQSAHVAFTLKVLLSKSSHVWYFGLRRFFSSVSIAVVLAWSWQSGLDHLNHSGWFVGWFGIGSGTFAG